jgi:hypothetical protein
LEAGLADEPLHLSLAEFALLQWFIVDPLKRLEDLSAFGALILVNRHFRIPPKSLFIGKIYNVPSVECQI